MSQESGRRFDFANQLYSQLSRRAGRLSHFVLLYQNEQGQGRTYRGQHRVHPVEIHVLNMIDERPGVTITVCARLFGRTSSAISQTVAKLESKGYIYRKKKSTNAKQIHLFTTQMGAALSEDFRHAEILEVTTVNRKLLEVCTVEEVATFNKVLESYIDILSKAKEEEDR